MRSVDFVVGCPTQLLDFSARRYSEYFVALRSVSVAVVVALVGPDEAGPGIVVELAVVGFGVVAEPAELGIAVDVALALDIVAGALDTVVAVLGPGNAVVAKSEPDRVELDPGIAAAVHDRSVVAPLHVPDTAAGAWSFGIAAGTAKQRSN